MLGNVVRFFRNVIQTLLRARMDNSDQRVASEAEGYPSPRCVSILDGSEVALEVLQAIGYRTVLKTATIVSYNMQDYDFWGQGALSHLLLRQLSLGASIRLMTTPPPGNPKTGGAFQHKYKLLSELQRQGVEVFLNEKLHAKAYLFQDSNNAITTIVGSANLTGPGFGMRLAPAESLVEMAVSCDNHTAFQDAINFVNDRILNDNRTEEFTTWFTRHSVEIGKAGV